MKKSDREIHDVWDKLLPNDLTAFINLKAPKPVVTRIAKAKEHYFKALRLRNIDEEMAAIRLIACEEELVVAIFKILETKKELLPVNIKFVKKYTDHHVKQSFIPVLVIFKDILEDFFNKNVQKIHDGTDIRLHFQVIFKKNKVIAQIADSENNIIISNPKIKDFYISVGNTTHEQIIETIYKDLSNRYKAQQSSIKDFMHDRVAFRNKLLYATDEMVLNMETPLDELLEDFDNTIIYLSWAIALLLDDHLSKNISTLINQFIGVYKNLLDELRQKNI